MKEAQDTYNLCSEPWLPCLDQEGRQVHLGLVDALVRAHELRGLADPSPLVTAALTRMLLAIVHRSIEGPATIAAWLELVKQGRLPADRVRRYLESVRSRFDLFDPDRPFAQVRGLAVEPADACTLLTPRSNWGGGTGLFHHRPPAGAEPLAPDLAARWLVARQAFDVSGTVSGGTVSSKPKTASAGPLTATAVVLVRGASLFETLVSNLLVYSPERSQPIPALSTDRPHWEQDPQSAISVVDSVPRRMPTGWLDLLTWLSRRIELVVESGRVVGWKRAVWQGVSADAARDPMVAWVIDDKTGARAVRIDTGRAFWRNSHALFEGAASHGKRHRRPATLAQLARSEARKVFPVEQRFHIDVLGMATKKQNQAAIEVERWDRLSTTASLLADPDAADEVRGGIEIAESVHMALRQGLWSFAAGALSPGEREPSKDDVSRLLDSLGYAAEYWSAAESAFSAFLDRLSAGEHCECRKQIREDCARIAVACFERSVRSLGDHARMARAIATATGRFRAKLSSLLSANEEGAS